jgi:hypothetical protein
MDKSTVIQCHFCKKKLINVIARDTHNTVTKVEVNCPFCGGTSGELKFEGQLFCGPIGIDESVNPTSIINIDYNDNKDLIVRISKRGK